VFCVCLKKSDSAEWEGKKSLQQSRGLKKFHLKMMLIIFVSILNMIHWEFPPEDQTVNAAHYRDHLWKGAEGEWSEAGTVPLPPSYNAAVVKQFLASRKVVVLHHLPTLFWYSCFLFPKLNFLWKFGTSSHNLN
jgi:hypothetical protein